jgi:protein disulfide-isomerase A1
MNANLYNKNIGVTELTINDFTINTNKITLNHKLFNGKQGLIIFYAPWCAHCREIVPLWSYLGLSYSDNFVIAAVNCENKVNQGINDKLNIKRIFPTIKFVNSDKLLVKYKGTYNKEDLIYFICSKI